MNELVNDRGDCRTAPATPSLLVTSGHYTINKNHCNLIFTKTINFFVASIMKINYKNSNDFFT